MSSSEEYLDNLLKSLTEDSDSMSADPKLTKKTEDIPEALQEPGMAADAENSNAMSADDLEAMFATMGEEMPVTEDAGDTLTSNENILSGEPAFDEELFSDGTGLDDNMLSGGFALNEDNLPDELALDENMLSDDLSLNDSMLSDGFELDEDGLPDELVLDENMLSDDLSLNDSMLSDGVTLAEDGLSDELTLDESMLPDELSLEDDMLAEGFGPDEGELSLDEGGFSDELVLDEDGLSDEIMSDESGFPDELALDESGLSGELTLDEGGLSDESALDEGGLSEELMPDESMFSDELTLDEESLSDELALDGSMLPDELSLDESGLSDELALDEVELPDGFALDESALSEEDFASDANELEDELMLGETGADAPIMEDFALEDDKLPDELTLDDSLMSDSEMSTDELNLDGLMEEESDSASADLGLDDLMLDDLGLDDLGLEENPEGGDDMLEGFDTDADSEGIDDFALEESDDSDLSALLAGMGADEDLSEINDLLEKSDQGVAVDDDMLAMLGGASDSEEGSGDSFFGELTDDGLENIREITPEELEERNSRMNKRQKKKEEKERKKKEKQAKKDAKKAGKKKGAKDTDAGAADDLSGLLGDSEDNTGEKPKKKGGFSRLLDFLLEEEEDEDGSGDGLSGDDGLMLGGISDENKELLAELKEEDKKNGKKKGKKDKKAKKGKKGKKGAEAGAEDEGGEEIEIKEKKPKKDKKKKKKEKSAEEESQTPEKKLSKKKVISTFLFCTTIAVCIVVVTLLLPMQFEKQEARVAYDHAQYEQVYDLLYGKKLSEEDELLLEKSAIILQLERKFNSFENYQKMDKPLEALDALLEGVRRYQNLQDDAEQHHMGDELYGVYDQILAALSQNYGLSEADALDIIASGDDVTYSQKVRAIVYGEVYGSEGEEIPEMKQDVLPEEEEIINRLQGEEQTDEADDGETEAAEEQ